MGLNSIILKIKCGETLPFRVVRGMIRAVVYPRGYRIPRPLKPFLRCLYEAHFLLRILGQRFVYYFYRLPLFQGRCASVGRRLYLGGLPYVNGHTEIHLGDDVLLGASIMITSGRFVDRPVLRLKDRAQIGANTRITVNREVIIEEDVRVSFDCRISDSDGHPREADLRAQDAPIDPREIKPVRIGRYAWVGNGSHIMKGVTIGEGAIIGANSVVISDIPPYCLAMGNPAEVYFRNVGRPKNRTAAGADS